MSLKIKYLSIIVILGTTLSCVPTRQFKELQENHLKCNEERDRLKNTNESLTVNNTELGSTIEFLQLEISELVADSTKRSETLQELRRNYLQLDQRYSDLQKAQDELIKGNVEETKKLLTELQKAQEDLQIKEDELRELEISLNEKRENLDILNTELEERNKRMLELEEILYKKDSAVNVLKNNVSAALMGFEGEGLTIRLQNGKVYVSLEEQLLFGSGSTRVDPEGISALKKLAKVLEENPDINIMIEGHTDDVPYISDESIKDNWDLSVKRATAIVRILLEDSAIDPRRLVAAGRGEFMPVDPSDTDEARQKNRRTEIILTPKLDELFKILENN